MPSSFPPIPRLVLASHNPGKLVEIAELLAPFAVAVVSAGDLGLPEPEETGSTFIENAELKARAAATGAGLPALADDSGIVINALGGAPGIYSARWAGEAKDFSAAMDRVAREMGDNPDRSAHFISALSVAWPDGTIHTVEGRVDGIIVHPRRGARGFGYDPIFQPLGHDLTFGEMDPAVKNAMSHRARAFARLIDSVFRRAA